MRCVGVVVVRYVQIMRGGIADDNFLTLANNLLSQERTHEPPNLHLQQEFRSSKRHRQILEPGRADYRHDLRKPLVKLVHVAFEVCSSYS